MNQDQLQTLKSQAYDALAAIQFYQKHLADLNNQIQYLAQAPQSSPVAQEKEAEAL